MNAWWIIWDITKGLLRGAAIFVGVLTAGGAAYLGIVWMAHIVKGLVP